MAILVDMLSQHTGHFKFKVLTTWPCSYLGYTMDTINENIKQQLQVMCAYNVNKKNALHLRKPNTAHEYRRMAYVYFKLRNAP